MNIYDYMLGKFKKDEWTKKAGCTIGGICIGQGLMYILLAIVARMFLSEFIDTLNFLILSMFGVMLTALGIMLLYGVNKDG